MLKLNGIREIPSQIFRVNIDQGTIRIKLMHKPAISMWFMDVSFGDNFDARGLRVQRNYNMLHQYNKLIPFGIYIKSTTGVEPTLIDDFSTKRIEINITTQAEKESIESSYEVR